MEAILDFACCIVGSIVLMWTIVTIIKTDGLFKYKYNHDTNETEEVANND